MKLKNIKALAFCKQICKYTQYLPVALQQTTVSDVSEHLPSWEAGKIPENGKNTFDEE